MVIRKALTKVGETGGVQTVRVEAKINKTLIININPPGTKGFGTHTKHQGGGGSKRTPPVSQEREMLQT